MKCIKLYSTVQLMHPNSISARLQKQEARLQKQEARLSTPAHVT